MNHVKKLVYIGLAAGLTAVLIITFNWYQESANVYAIDIPITAQPAVNESIVRYNQDYGAMRIQTNDACINLSFFNRDEKLIDSYTIKRVN